MNNAREYIGKPEVYRFLRDKARNILMKDPDDLVQDTCLKLLEQEKEFEGEGHFRSSSWTLLYQQRIRNWHHSNRAKRSAFVVEFKDQIGEEGAYDETFRLEPWADDPTIKLALQKEKGFTLVEIAAQEGVSRQAIEQRIERKLANVSREFR